MVEDKTSVKGQGPDHAEAYEGLIVILRTLIEKEE